MHEDPEARDAERPLPLDVSRDRAARERRLCGYHGHRTREGARARTRWQSHDPEVPGPERGEPADGASEADELLGVEPVDLDVLRGPSGPT